MIINPVLAEPRTDPKDEIKTQMESDAMQPCKLYFGEPGNGGWAGTAVGGEDMRKKERIQAEKAHVVRIRSAGGGGHRLPPPRIQQCPAMSSWLSLCAGMEALARAEPSTKAARRRARERGLLGACTALYRVI